MGGNVATVDDVESWRGIVGAAERFGTPFFALWRKPFVQAVKRAQSVTGVAESRHWYSYKSQPVPALARTAAELGLGVEVVSPFELFAAHRLGFAPSNILVNGLAKHSWLPNDVTNLNVIFDSLTEVHELASVARRLEWRCGLRIAVTQQVNADEPRLATQFGVDLDDAVRATRILAAQGADIDILHVHLRSNVPDISDYRAALAELRDVASVAGLVPRVIDVGGGLPDRGLPTQSTVASTLTLGHLGDIAAAARAAFPYANEIWFENGRALLAPGGVLVVSILDIKERNGYRMLVCDGGRTNHALPSDWETHLVALARNPKGPAMIDTIVCGPTCMAFDSFYQGPFTTEARIGDRIIYFNAGAYHIPWETRFSFGECRVLWTEDGLAIREIRRAEQPEQWLARWTDL